MASESAQPGQDHGTLYHLVQKELWQEAKGAGKPYYPPTYEAVSDSSDTTSGSALHKACTTACNSIST